MEEIKEKIEKIVKEISQNKNLAKEFQKDPIATVKKIIGLQLPDDTIEKVIAGVKTKLTADKAKTVLDDAMSFLKK